MIPEKTLQEIQERLDIVEVIGGYISVKKAGHNFKALCPFHPEKTPSFMVYQDKQFFICYGCGAGGDLVSFVMRHEHVEFPEAVRILAQKAGVSVPDVRGTSGSPEAPDLYKAHELATQFYQELLTKSQEGEKARVYLEKRGVLPATWQTFALGYAPSQWDRLLSHAQSEHLEPALLERSGLVIAREAGNGWYDRFRHRVMFPVWDARGRVIGFGGRLMEKAGPADPKYMNSPETELYVKGRILYGWHLASSQIRKKDFCIVVEGYMDLVTPYQHGIRNIVASMGTSLTHEQVRLIRRLTRHVVIVYDGDYAGEMASLRGLDLFLEAEMRVKVAALPAGFDPDSLIREKGIEAFVRVIQDSQDLFDYKLGLLKRREDPKNLEGRVRMCAEMLPTIQRVANAIERGEYIKRLGEALGVEESLLWAELNRVKSGNAWKPEAVVQPKVQRGSTPEDLLAGLLLEEPSRWLYVEERLHAEELREPMVRDFIQFLKQRHEEGKLPKDHRELLRGIPGSSGEWQGSCAQWLALADTVSEKEKTLDELLAKVQSQRRRASLESLKALIRQAEASGDETQTVSLVEEYSRLVRETMKVSL